MIQTRVWIAEGTVRVEGIRGSQTRPGTLLSPQALLSLQGGLVVEEYVLYFVLLHSMFTYGMSHCKSGSNTWLGIGNTQSAITDPSRVNWQGHSRR